jgi:hypothetical protein
VAKQRALVPGSATGIHPIKATRFQYAILTGRILITSLPGCQVSVAMPE